MRLIQSLWSMAMIVVMGFSLSACVTTVKRPVSQQPQPPAKRYLFLVSAKSANLSKTNTSGYVVNIVLPAIHQVVAFTDRPYRQAHFSSAKQFHELWSIGANNFATNHPNAVLSAKNLRPVIVEINHVKTHANDIMLYVRPLAQKIKHKTKLQQVALTIAATSTSNQHLNSSSLLQNTTN